MVPIPGRTRGFGVAGPRRRRNTGIGGVAPKMYRAVRYPDVSLRISAFARPGASTGNPRGQVAPRGRAPRDSRPRLDARADGVLAVKAADTLNAQCCLPSTAP